MNTELKIIKKSAVEGKAFPIMDWKSINEKGMFTRTQGKKLKIELDEMPCAQYQSQKGYVMLYQKKLAGL